MTPTSFTTRAVILARGLGTRMQAADAGVSLPDDQQRAADRGLKAMMPIHGRPFLDYVLSAAADAGVAQVAIVVAPDHHDLRQHYQNEAPPSHVSLDFVVQPEARGTADAVLAAEDWTRQEPFLLLNGDNLYPPLALSALRALRTPGLAGFDREDLFRTGNIPADRLRAFALLEQDDHGRLLRIVEKPTAEDEARLGSHAAVSMNCWRFDHRIFDACRTVPPSPRGELELPAAVAVAMAGGVPFTVVPATGPVLDLSRRADAPEIAGRLAAIDPRP